jgi:hypothetical protein
MNVVRATNGSPVFQGKLNELPDIYNLRINTPTLSHPLSRFRLSHPIESCDQE